MTKELNQRGYTLIELIVSVAIFSIVMLIAGAAFLTLISLDRKARATNDLVTNLSYVVDSMERSIRTGTLYTATSGGNCFSFTDANGILVSYRLSSGSQGQVEQRTGSSAACTTGTWIALTDPRVDVENLAFYSSGTVVGDSAQPQVIMVLRGRIKPDTQTADIEFVIESSATQRLIDI